MTHTQAIAQPTSTDFWKQAVVYQVYLRSFRDADGDGVGDLRGLQRGLDDIAELGCDAIWINPCYPSPQRDHGYDVADYRAVDPQYGTLADLDAVLDRAHQLGLKVLLDLVPNHCSEEHRWFQEALKAAPGSPERDRFLFRDGRGRDHQQPPNNWQSVFGGPAWTQVRQADGSPGQWYLHSFDSSQPDFNWRNPEVRAEFLDVLRFWFDRGVDGFRIDVAHGLMKDPELPDHDGDHPNPATWDQPEVHEIYRSWRALGDDYPEPKHWVAEAWLAAHERLADYVRPDELQQAFEFELMIQPWDAQRVRGAINQGLEITPTPAWALANHDVHRVVTRYGQAQVFDDPDPTAMIDSARRVGPVDIAVGTSRARAAAALMLALPGAAYLYQGEELGLPEVLDLPDAARTDPMWLRSGGTDLGRDGCRVPLPWSSDAANFGFSPAGGAPAWLPQPEWFAGYARAVQQHDPRSMLSLYRALLAERTTLFGTSTDLQWLDGPDGVVAFRRGDGVCVVNFGADPVSLPNGWRLGRCVVATGPVDTTELPGNSARWYARSGAGRG